MGNRAYKVSHTSAGRCRNGDGQPIAPGSVAECTACLRRKQLRKYGETGVERFAAQGYRCAVCRRRISRTNIDHCKKERGGCGAVRAVLCKNCNVIEGEARSTGESPWIVLRRMADYMEWHDTKDCPGHDALALCDPPEAYE